MPNIYWHPPAAPLAWYRVLDINYSVLFQVTIYVYSKFNKTTVTQMSGYKHCACLFTLTHKILEILD